MSNNHNVKREINQLIKEYACIRSKFENYKDRHPRYLKGNDNYVGIIGEYWATIFLEQEYESAINHCLDRKEEKDHSNSEEWLDFTLEYEEDKIMTEFISVKAISSENKQGMSGIIKYFSPENKETEILSVIIIKLDVNLMPEQLLYIKNLDSSLENCIGKRNYSEHWQVGKKSLAFKYYKHGGFDKIFSSKVWEWKDDKFIQI